MRPENQFLSQSVDPRMWLSVLVYLGMEISLCSLRIEIFKRFTKCADKE